MTANEMLQYYREHRMTVDEAVKLVNSGDLIIDGHGRQSRLRCRTFFSVGKNFYKLEAAGAVHAGNAAE